jgi:diguanylate cyclase (GGDEF)-like protein/PAS domain S-box-containing protein
MVMVNPAFTEITGYRPAEALGRNPHMLSAGLDDDSVYRDMWSAIEQEGSWHGELWNRRKDGSVYAEMLSITRVCDGNGQVQNYVSIFSDVTERRRIEEQVQWLAHFDSLTGLPNRALLSERADQALSLAQRVCGPLAVMFLDIDHFKAVNDSLGHRIGDLLLIEVAQRLQAAVREHDTVSRQGGDEFVIILPDTDAAGAAHVAEKIRCLIAEPMMLDSHPMSVSASIGIALFPQDAGDFDTLCRAADQAMYRAKQDGRNCYRYCQRAI